MSAIEETFALQLRAYNIEGFERELTFHPKRRWRLDFAHHEKKIAVEIDGGIFGRKSGHNTGVGILKKMEKLNHAQLLGWRVFSFSSDQVKSLEALNFIKPLFE